MTDLAYLTASEALAGFAARTLSPVEVLDALIARAESVEKTHMLCLLADGVGHQPAENSCDKPRRRLAAVASTSAAAPPQG